MRRPSQHAIHTYGMIGHPSRVQALVYSTAGNNDRCLAYDVNSVFAR